VKKCEEKRGQLEKYIYREKNIKIRKKRQQEKKPREWEKIV